MAQSFNISWIYKAIDKFSQPAKKMRVASDKLRASVKRVGTAVTQVRGRVRAFGTSLRTSAGSMENLQSKMMAFAAVAATAFLIAFPLRQAIRFEEAMADVNKVVDFARPDGLRMMSLDILDLSRRIPIAATGLAEIAAAGGQFGIAEKNLIQFTETVAKMSTAFELMPGETGKAVAILSNIFEIPIDKFEGFADRINEISNTVVGDAGEIIRALQNKGAAAGTSMGLTAEGTLALASTFLQLGTRADRVGSIMDSMSRRLKNVSIMGEDFVQAFTDKPRETLLKLFRVINKMPAGAKKSQILLDVFGEFSTRLEKVIDTMDKKFLPTLALADDAIGAAGSVTEEFLKRSATAAAKLQLMKNALGVVSEAIGFELLPVVKAITDHIGSFANGIATVISWTGPLVPALFAAAFAILAVAAATKVWAIAMVVFSLAATPIGLIIVALAGIGTAIVWLSDKFGGFINLLKHLGNTIMLSLLFPLLMAAKAIDALFDTNIEDRIKDFSKQVTFDIQGGLEPTVNQDSRTQVDINVNAPRDAVSSVETKSTGPAEMNVGQNLELEGAG